jgi:hypothetical protein
MGNRRKQYENEPNVTSVAQIFAILAAGFVFFNVESTLYDFQRSGDQLAHRLPGWQVHMGSVCVSLIVFVIVLFFFEFVGRKLKTTAWRLSWPWLPLIGFTGIGTLVHLSRYLGFPAIAIHVVWAYRWTRIER